MNNEDLRSDELYVIKDNVGNLVFTERIFTHTGQAANYIIAQGHDPEDFNIVVLASVLN